MRSIRTGLILLLLAGTVLTATSCEQQGPAEKAGEAIDDATAQGADAVATAGASVKDAVDK